MMKKILFPIFLALTVSGCSILSQKTTQVEVPPAEQQTMNDYQKLADAMATGKSVECVMTNTQKGTSFVYQVKGKMIRTFGQLNPDATSSGNMISDGTYLYTWSDDSQSGTKFKIPTEAKTAESVEQSKDVLPDLSDQTKQQEFIDSGYTIQCDPINLTDDTFIPPITVKFQDLSQMMDSANQFQAKMASGAGESAPELSQEQIEAMMKSFGDGE